MEYGKAAAVFVLAYLLGSINFAVIFSGLFLKKDVRSLGSGNAGATNMLRVGGILPGVLTFICDALKGFLACMAGKWTFAQIGETAGSAWAVPIYGAYLCGIVCMLGHVYPIFFHFRGGKGVAVSVGIFYVCSPISITFGLIGFAISLLFFKMVSLSSLVGTVIVLTLSIVFFDRSGALWPQAIAAAGMALIVVLKHRANIQRILAGTESKIKLGRR